MKQAAIRSLRYFQQVEGCRRFIALHPKLTEISRYSSLCDCYPKLSHCSTFGGNIGRYSECTEAPDSITCEHDPSVNAISQVMDHGSDDILIKICPIRHLITD